MLVQASPKSVASTFRLTSVKYPAPLADKTGRVHMDLDLFCCWVAAKHQACSYTRAGVILTQSCNHIISACGRRAYYQVGGSVMQSMALPTQSAHRGALHVGYNRRGVPSRIRRRAAGNVSVVRALLNVQRALDPSWRCGIMCS